MAHPEVLGGDILVVTAEYDQWVADTDGAAARDRLDILGLDETGRLVVVELKRGEADRDVHLQSITYAALVSRFTIDTLAEAHQQFLRRRGRTADIDECRKALIEHAGGDLDPELLRRPRQIVVAGTFPKQVTHSVVWLSENNLDIDLVQVSVWRVGEHVVAGFTKIYPTPEAEEFTLGPARAETGMVQGRVRERVRARNAAELVVEAELLPDGIRLRMRPEHGTTASIREAITAWVAEDATRGTATWRNHRSRPLFWDHDQQPYSTTGLANKVFEEVTGRRPDGIQGTRWWVIDTSERPSDIDETEWEALEGKTLADIAKGLRAGPRDWEDLHQLLADIPHGRWTTYGDIADVIGSGAIAVGRHLSACDRCVRQWIILNRRGRVSAGFHLPSSAELAGHSPEELLLGEGVRMTAGMADPAQRMSAGELRRLVGGPDD